MQLCQLTDVPINRLVALRFRGILAFHLDRANDLLPTDSLGDDEVEAVIAMWKVHIPSGIRETASSEQFGEVVRYFRLHEAVGCSLTPEFSCGTQPIQAREGRLVSEAHELS